MYQWKNFTDRLTQKPYQKRTMVPPAGEMNGYDMKKIINYYILLLLILTTHAYENVKAMKKK